MTEYGGGGVMEGRGIIRAIQPGSIAGEVGLQPGDKVIAINGNELGDILDYHLACAGEELEVYLKKDSGEEWVLDIEKDYDEDLGIIFTSPALAPVKKCANRCIFCFIDQMPPGMRPSLYVKDDDYRLSFLHGNFITLTNLKEYDMRRIEGQHLSPLYLSIHTTDPALRKKMLDPSRGVHILEDLERLTRAGIEIHGQVVLCPGINDGPHLDRTLRDLVGLGPGFKSLAVVPVGLTRYRKGLYPLVGFTPTGAGEVLQQVAQWQQGLKTKTGRRLVFPADEFFLLAGEEVPPDPYYEGYPQTENGVGLLRLFLNGLDRWQGHPLPPRVAPPQKISLVTGKLAAPYLQGLTSFFQPVQGLDFKVWEVENKTLGREVTVAGLVCGRDILEALGGKGPGDLLLLPDVMLNQQGKVFLDDCRVQDLEGALQVRVRVINSLLENTRPEDFYL